MIAETKYIDIIFDGPPGPISGRFVEVEDDKGRGFDAGEWVERADGFWALRINVGSDGMCSDEVQG